MRPGKLDQRITVQYETLSNDGYGGQTVALTDRVSLWANVAPLAGRELEYGQQLESSNYVVFTIRYREDILFSDRIIYNGEQYNIRAMPPPGTRKMYRTIEAERGVAQ